MRPITVAKNIPALVETVMYTVPKGYYAVWNLMYAHNSLGAIKTLTVHYYDASANVDVHILDQKIFTAKEYFQFSGNDSGIVMEEGDQVRVDSEGGSAFGVVCTFNLHKV